MHTRIRLTFIVLLLALPLIAAQASEPSDRNELKMAALEALISAPPERALPIAKKVLAGNHDDAVKSRALFVLSQIETAEARDMLIDIAKTGDGDLQLDAIRMVGINGDPATMDRLEEVYAAGNRDVKESVLHAMLIADDAEAVFRIAKNASDDDEFEIAVHVLGQMGATEQLAKLRDRPGASESYIHALAIAGDVDSLRIIANDGSDPERQMQAMHGLGIAGGKEVGPMLRDIYRGSDNKDVRKAAMHGLMIADSDDALLELFRESSNAEEKKDLLRLLVMMDSDAALTVIDEALDGGR